MGSGEKSDEQPQQQQQHEQSSVSASKIAEEARRVSAAYKAMAEEREDLRPRAKPRRFEMFTSLLAGAAGIASVVGVTVILSAGVSGFGAGRRDAEVSVLTLRQEVTEQGVKTLGGDIKRIEAQIQAILKLPAEAQTTAELKRLADEVTAISGKYDILSTAISDNPARAVSVPLLRKEIEHMQQRQRDGLLASQQQIDRVYEQNYWFIGLMVTLSVGLIGIAAGNLYRSTKEQ